MRTAWAMLALTLTTGCAAQADTGWGWRNPDRAPRVVRLSGRTTNMRQSGPTLGLRGAATVESDGVAPRNTMVGVGYQVRPSGPWPDGFGFDASLELGMGEPLYVDYPGLGGYVGVEASVPYRIVGDADFDPNAYNTMAILLDLVVAGSTGVWTPPAGSAGGRALGELNGHLGVRVTFGTDATQAPSPPEDEEEAEP